MPHTQLDIPATKEEREAFDEFVKKVEQGLVDSEIIEVILPTGNIKEEP